jgi:YegS/Rv2252/BmrU family lipid kinase
MKPTKATIIYNPVSGRSLFRERKVWKMIRLLGERGVVADAAATYGPETGASLAREAVGSGSEVIICHGGDGTLNEVLQGIAGSSAKLAVWAGGTANVAAAELNMPHGLNRVADVIARGKTMQVSVGIAENAVRSRYFLMFAGIGLDASICRGVVPRLKRLTGQIAFWVSGIKHLVAWRETRFSIAVNGQRYESGFSLIANGKGYGGGIRMAPGARLDEDQFQVFMMPAGAGRSGYLRALINIVAGRTDRTGGRLVAARSVVAESSAETWVQVDGELIGTLPMSFHILPQALLVLIP